MSYKRRSPLPVVEGGTEIQTTTAYAPIVGGATATGPFQVPTGGAGVDGQILVSRGPTALPEWTNDPAMNMTYKGIVFADSPYPVAINEDVIGADSTGGAIIVQLEDAPSSGRLVFVKDLAGQAGGANTITITTVTGAVLIDGATTFVMNTAYQSGTFVFTGTAYAII